MFECIWGGFLVNVLFLAWQGILGHIDAADAATYEIRLFLLLLIGIFICLSTRTLSRINQKKLGELNKEKEVAISLLYSPIALKNHKQF